MAAQAVKSLDTMTKHALSDFSARDHSSSSSSSRDSSPVSSCHSKRRGKPKSSRVAKSHDIVIKTLQWPHTFLKYSHMSLNVDFNMLDLPLLVAGELEIAKSHSATSKENLGRAELLQSLMYSSKIYTWSNCLDYFGAVLAFIERGGEWTDNLTLNTIQQNTLLQRESSRANPSGTGTPFSTGGVAHSQHQTWYCRAFQSGDCSLPDGHDQLMRGKQIKMHHICAFCLTNKKIMATHSEIHCNAGGKVNPVAQSKNSENHA